MLVIRNELLAVVHRLDLAGEESIRLRAPVAVLTAGRVAVLLRAADVLLFGHILRGLAERDRVIAEIDHARIDQSPSKRRVGEHALASREGLGWLPRDQWRAAHALDAARDDDVGLARADPPRRIVHGLEPAAAEPVDGDPRHAFREAREERGHPDR